jgi:hypothetical protein
MSYRVWNELRAARANKYIVMAKYKNRFLAPIAIHSSVGKEDSIKSAQEAKGFIKVWVVELVTGEIVWERETKAKS